MKKIHSLKVSNEIKVQSPCSEKWSAMTGNQKVRHCEICVHSVNNLSAMTRHEAKIFLEGTGGKRVCVRYERDKDGSVKYKTGAVAAFFSTLITLISYATASSAEEPVVMGDISPEYTDISGGITYIPQKTPVAEATSIPKAQTEEPSDQQAESDSGNEREYVMGKFAVSEN